MDESNDIRANFFLHNNAPDDDFLGLTPIKISDLLHDTFGTNSPVRLRDDIDDSTLDQVPIFRMVEMYLKIIERDKQIKLTPLGAIPRKILVEIYEKKCLLDMAIERGIQTLLREDDWKHLRSARINAELAGFVKKVKNKITLTKKGIKLLETNNRLEIFKQFFKTFTEKFNWSYNDYYTEAPIAQYGWAFSVILLDKFGDQPINTNFYAKLYLTAFPSCLQYFKNPIYDPLNEYQNCYSRRTFYYFFLLFGFVTIVKKQEMPSLSDEKYNKTNILKSIFQIDCP